MINGGESGIINDDLITNVEQKSSIENEPWEIILAEKIYVWIPYKLTSTTVNLHCVLDSSSLFDMWYNQKQLLIV